MSSKEARNILGVKEGASEKELKSAYRAKSLQAHPDKGGSEKEFIRVAQAYELLKGGGKLASDGSAFGRGGQKADFDAASSMFDTMFEGLDLLSDGGLAAAKVDELLFHEEDGSPTELGIAGRMWRWAVLRAVRLGAPMLLSFLESDTVNVEFNGETVRGSDLKEYREQRRQKRHVPAERPAEPVDDL